MREAARRELAARYQAAGVQNRVARHRRQEDGKFKRRGQSTRAASRGHFGTPPRTGLRDGVVTGEAEMRTTRGKSKDKGSLAPDRAAWQWAGQA